MDIAVVWFLCCLAIFFTAIIIAEIKGGKLRRPQIIKGFGTVLYILILMFGFWAMVPVNDALFKKLPAHPESLKYAGRIVCFLLISLLLYLIDKRLINSITGKKSQTQ